MNDNKQTTGRLVIAAACLGCLAVAIGAFGAHGLKPLLIENGRLDVFETAVKYHFYHTFALLALAILSIHFHYSLLHYAALLFLMGTFFFSGSLYALSIWKSLSFLGPITPIGGLLLICGWVLLILSGWRILKGRI